MRHCIVDTMLAFIILFLSMVSNAGVAKDITQDIFLHIWEKRLNIDLEGNFDGYLFKISQNMVYHYVRRELLLQNYVMTGLRMSHLTNRRDR